MTTAKNVLTLGDRMKLYEQALDVKLNPCMHYMIRLDGKNFSKHTKRWPLEKPFDERFNNAITAAGKSLYHLIPNIHLVWCGSDEISAWFTFPDAGNPFYDGRIQKQVVETYSPTEKNDAVGEEFDYKYALVSTLTSIYEYNIDGTIRFISSPTAQC